MNILQLWSKSIPLIMSLPSLLLLVGMILLKVNGVKSVMTVTVMAMTMMVSITVTMVPMILTCQGKML